jgi:hypothetical protein
MASIGGIACKIIAGQLIGARRETYEVDRPGVSVHGLTATAPRWPAVELVTHTYVASGQASAVTDSLLALIGTDPPAAVVDQFGFTWSQVDVLDCVPEWVPAIVQQGGILYVGIVVCRWRLRPLTGYSV